MRYLILVLTMIAVGCAPQTPPQQDAAADPAAPKGRPDKARPEPARPVGVTLPEGTVLKVRTTNTLSTKTHHAGDKFEASLEEAIEQGGQVLVPRGARVEGKIVESDEGGRVKGRAELSVRLTQLHVNENKSVDLETNTLAREAKATHKEDAAKIGIGAGVGAAIGAIAGGGRGAGIGAASGGAAGTGLVLATRGKSAVLPGESVLSFRLRAPVTISR
jgi:hypothetical protein